MAMLSIPSTGISTAVAASLTTVFTASGKQRVVMYITNPTTAAIDVLVRTGTTGGATETIEIAPKTKQCVYEGVQPNTGIIQLGGSTSLVYEGYATAVS